MTRPQAPSRPPALRLPFLTASHPLVAAEGALDPLGLAPLGDRLAELLVPGMRVRMARPRFLTAIAAAAHVCDGLTDEPASDGVSTPQIAFEWLMVEGLVRGGDRDAARRTPGIEKAQTAFHSRQPLCAATYLKAPSIFGFHGVYRPLATSLNIVDDDFRLADAGYGLLRVWEEEQGLQGFLDRSTGSGRGGMLRQSWRSAVEDAMSAAQSNKSSSWSGWKAFSEHLVPGSLGAAESTHLLGLFGRDGGSRAELFRELAPMADSEEMEAVIAASVTRKLSADPVRRIRAIERFEVFATSLEHAFDIMRFESSSRRTEPLTPAAYAAHPEVVALAQGVQDAIARAADALEYSPLSVQQRFTDLARPFDTVRDGAELFHALLTQHRGVQAAKPPAGKRDWFEQTADGSVFVRPLYRQETRPERDESGWGRPYRLAAIQSFLRDLKPR